MVFYNCWKKAAAYQMEGAGRREEEQSFHQDAVPPQTANFTMALLIRKFGERLISRIAEVE